MIPQIFSKKFAFELPAQLTGTPAEPLLQLLNKSGVPADGENQPGAIFPSVEALYESGHL